MLFIKGLLYSSYFSFAFKLFKLLFYLLENLLINNKTVVLNLTTHQNILGLGSFEKLPVPRIILPQSSQNLWE